MNIKKLLKTGDTEKDSLNKSLEYLGIHGTFVYIFPMVLATFIIMYVIKTFFVSVDKSIETIIINNTTSTPIILILSILIYIIFCRYVFVIKKQSIIDCYTRK
jgi:hypothetical protein